MFTVLFFLLWVPVQLCYAQDSFARHFADSALSLTKQHVVYDASYKVLAYPLGDVAPDKGVCTDVVIRAYRKFGIDLQKLVHEDMKAHFALYPKKYKLSKPDRNIDHRRVPNLMVFFSRYGGSLPITSQASDYKPGDLVCWKLFGTLTHIGIVSAVPSSDGQRFQIIHNIGSGQVLEDCLFAFDIIGHYRYGS